MKRSLIFTLSLVGVMALSSLAEARHRQRQPIRNGIKAVVGVAKAVGYKAVHPLEARRESGGCSSQ